MKEIGKNYAKKLIAEVLLAHDRKRADWMAAEDVAREERGNAS